MSNVDDRDTKYKLSKKKALPNLHIAGQLVPIISKEDYELSFKEQISITYRKINTCVKIVYRVRHKLPQKCRRVLYFLFIFSCIYYFEEGYDNVSFATLKPQESVQNRILRTIQSTSSFSLTNKMQKSCIFKIQDIVQHTQNKMIRSHYTEEKKLQAVLDELMMS